MHGQETRARSSELRPGDVFADHRIEDVLGRGGMGVVYRATDLRLNRAVALKVIKPELSHDDDFRRRFRRESELAASVRQGNVVTIFQAGDADGLLYVTMELIDGVDLRSAMSQRGRLDAATAAAMTAQVAAALDAAHASGLVHRDVKPANVLVANGAPMHLYLTDFGLTKRTGSQSQITKTGMFLGTIDYAAPEQIQGWPVDARADVYALGCVLFEMLTGRAPFKRENDYGALYAHMTEPPPAPSAAAPGVPAAFDDVIRRALAKSPDDRFPSAGDLARAARAAAHGEHPTEPERVVAVGPAAPSPPAPTQVEAPVSHVTARLAPQTPPPAAAPPPAAPPPAAPPPAHEPPRRSSPWPIVALLVALLAIGAAVAVVLVTSGDDGGGEDPNPPVAQQQQQQPQNQRQQRQTPPAEDPAVRADVERIEEILELSAEGRSLTASGDFQAAAENRREVLTQVEALVVEPELSEAHSLLRGAIDASFTSNLAHRNCGDCDAARTADERATELKADFVRVFNPFAERYLQRSYDPSKI